jgi:hypothetical protein
MNSELSFLLCLLTVLLLTPISVQSQGVQCTVCKNGAPVPLPQYQFDATLPVPNCGVLDLSVGVLSVDSALCNSAQTIETLCGCPMPPDPCTLCQDGTFAPNKTKTLDLFAADFLVGAPAESKLTCEYLEAILHQQDPLSSMCFDFRLEHSEECGCSAPSISGTNDTVVTLEPAPTAAPLEFCTLCIDGGAISDPSRPIDTTGTGLPLNNCSDLALFSTFLEKESELCGLIQFLGTFCGCQAQRNDCGVCANGEDPPNGDKKLTWFNDYLQVVPPAFSDFSQILTCDIFDAVLKNYVDGAFSLSSQVFCLLGEARGHICGCEASARTIALVWWSYRTSGMLSLLGSIAIISHIALYQKKKFNSNTYHQVCTS